jgi:hypothetical protein
MSYTEIEISCQELLWKGDRGGGGGERKDSFPGSNSLREATKRKGKVSRQKGSSL